MDTDLKKLKKIVKIMQIEGVLSLKTSDLEISLSPAALFPQTGKEKKLTQKLPAIPEEESLYTQEDALYWSSAGIPDEVQ